MPLHRLTVEARGLYDANEVRNDLMRGLRRGGFIDRDVRERSADALHKMNRAGYEAEFSIRYDWQPDSLFGGTALSPFILLANRDLMGVRFTEDAYRLTFFGNKDYAGTTADLSRSAYERISYQTIGFGVRAERGYVMLSLVNGQSLDAADLDHASIFTAMDGTSLTANIDGEYLRSDTSFASSFGGSNGLGAALSTGIAMRIGVFGRLWRLKIEVEDLGFIAWNDHSLGVETDRAIEYTGIKVDDLFDLGGVALSEADIRSEYGLGETESAVVRMLPAKFSAGISRHKRRRFRKIQMLPEQFTIDHRILPGYRPMATYNRTWLISRKLAAGGSLCYGGFGGLRIGAGVYTDHVAVRVPNLIGLFSDRARGAAAEVALSFAW